MGKRNAAVNNWLSDNRRFADLFNGAVFDGRQIIRAEELEDLDRETDIVISGKGGTSKGVQRYRDIVKRWRGGTDLAVLACESQARIHYAMPVRNMLYDSLAYTEQIRQIWKFHKNKRDKEMTENGDNKITEEEYLSRFRKTDSIVPVLTLVFYYDLKQWDGAQDLYGMFGLNMQTEEGRILCKYIPNYRINLVDAGNISDLGMFHTDLQQMLGVLKYRQDKKELKEYIYENRDYFAGVDVETYQALRAFLHSENMLKDFTVSGKEARIDMCQALEELYQDGVKEGREEGASMIILNMLKSGMSVSDIKNTQESRTA